MCSISGSDIWQGVRLDAVSIALHEVFGHVPSHHARFAFVGVKASLTDVTRAARIGIESSFTCWGAGIVDLDNDGYPDIFVVTGSVYPEVERTLAQYPNKSRRLLFRNLGDGTFEELTEQCSPGVMAPHCSRGCAFGDFDNDLDIDILVVNLNEPPSLLRNDLSGKNHWLKLKLVGTRSNRSAIGARIVVHYGGKVQSQSLANQASTRQMIRGFISV